MIRRMIPVLLLVLVAGSAFAQGMPAPGPEHQLLAKLAGEWDGTMTLRIPGVEPMSTPARNSAKLAHGGFWLIGEFSGTMMGIEFNGHSVMGYDPATKKWTESWVSNLAPEMAILVGTYDAATRTWTKTREGAKDMFTGAPATERHQLRMVDDNNYVLTIAQKAEGGEFQVLVELKQQRK